uniref:Uncharacterized protein n=1 Tax=Anguilla anguilla TaxID=7936 RepID=A0A0E9XHG5_ANGAN
MIISLHNLYTRHKSINCWLCGGSAFCLQHEIPQNGLYML